jgi:dTDP-4-dehydrorhamnose reductase
MRILVTGASGLLGLNLALEASRQHTVFGTVREHSLQTTAFEVVQADLTAPWAIERVLEQSQPDWVVHCAALAVLEACEADPDLAHQLNSEIPGKLAEYVARGGARLVHISTDAVFDGQRGGYRETDEPNPLSVYAHSKLEGERAVARANPQAIIARVNLFGWSLSGKRSLAEWFFNNLSTGQQVMGFTDVYFCPLLANDLAKLLLQMLEKDLSGLYHVVAGDCISKHDFGMAVARRFGFDERLIRPASVEQGGLQAARSPNLTLKTEKLTADLGAEPPSISSGLDRFYSLYSEDYPARLRSMAAE